MGKSNIIRNEEEEPDYLDGRLLIAMPGMMDPRFERSVIFMCAHSEDGAMGIVLNQPTEQISFADLLEQLDIEALEERVASSKDQAKDQAFEVMDIGEIDTELAAKPVYVGGPVETSRGFVLHSRDYYVADSTLPIENGVCLTATVDILRAIAHGKGPQRSFLALGYAGWAPGQLESEVQANGWLHCDADADIVFDPDAGDKYERALALLGIDPGFLAADAGHA